VKTLVVAIAVSLVGVGPAAATPDPVGFTGLGPVELRMTVQQGLATGAMAHDLAICPGEDTDFRPEYDARALWSRKDRLIGIQAQRAIRGVRVGGPASRVRAAFPGGSFRGRDIYTNGRIWVVSRPASALQFVLKRGKVKRITLTTGYVSTGGEWTC
jgi:hypothetical protein